MLQLLAVILLTLPPRPAAVLASLLTGADLGALLRVCHRESRCQAVGVHDRDAWLSRTSYGGQVQLGHLEPWCQPRAQQWATRGPWGLNAAAHWQFLPRCYSPAWLDVPLVSAVVAARKWRAVCEDERRSGWCPSTRSIAPIEKID